MSTEFIENLESPSIFSTIQRGNALPTTNIKTKPISWNYMQAPEVRELSSIKVDMFNRYYLDRGNPNPLSGIL